MLGLLAISASALVWAEPIQVRNAEGTAHAFLVVRDLSGKVIAGGELVQTTHGDKVKDHVFFHFKDGSIDDETTVFTEHGTFRLIHDHHIQRGPSFEHPIELTIDALSGTVTVRSTGKDGKTDETTDHLDLPPDLANGLPLIVLKNILPTSAKTEVSLLAATPKPRLIKLAIVPEGEQQFIAGGQRCKATHYQIKFELGGIAGMVAPLIGKQPEDVQAWILEGAAPDFIREQGPLYPGGPVWTIEQSAPVWPRSTP